MEKTKNTTNTIHYTLTFFSIAAVFGLFATHLITGESALIIMDSLPGSFVLGIIFLSYLCWFVYERAVSARLSIAQAIKSTLKFNPVAYCIYAYWIVFIVIPCALNILY